MADKGRPSYSTRSKSKLSATTQKTLLDHFSSKGKSNEVHNIKVTPVEVPDEAAKSNENVDKGGESTSSAHEIETEASNDTLQSKAETPVENGVQEPPESLPADIPPCSAPQTTLEIEEITIPRLSVAAPPPRKLFPIFQKQNLRSSISKIPNESDVVEVLDLEPTPEPSSPEIIEVVPTSQIFEGTSGQEIGMSHRVDPPISFSYKGSSDNPILVPSSPVRAPGITPSPSNSQAKSSKPIPKVTYSIFSVVKQKNEMPTSSPRLSKLRKDAFSEAVFPDQVSQHVRGPQRNYSHSGLPFEQQSKRRRISLSRAYDTPQRSLRDIIPLENNYNFDNHQRLNQLNFEDYLSTIPTEDLRHPALSAVTQHFSSFSPATVPTEIVRANRLRPVCAEQILGNEDHALYLRDWLCALELQFKTSTQPVDVAQVNGETGKGKGGSKRGASSKLKGVERGVKRPRIVRAVEKKKGKKKQRIDSEEEADYWIVNSEESPEEEATEDGCDDEQEFMPGLKSSRSETRRKQKTTLRNFDARLTNTILLAGPSGCGKTAAVYACTEELDWEVFEVYPGIGKRNGANLDSLIGEVGKNHIVRKAAHRQDFSSQEQKSKDKAQETTQICKDDQVIDITNFGFLSVSGPSETDPPSQQDNIAHDLRKTAKVRQSVVLFEEVDILFKDDVSFWPTVINFIKYCKRPVIMTCNDISLVPTTDLPLQTVLEFRPPPSSIAVSYLQCLCFASGRLFDRKSLAQLYGSPRDLSLGSRDVSPDLRQAIQQLQVWGLAAEGKSAAVLPVSGHKPDFLEDTTSWDWHAGHTRIGGATTSPSIEERLRGVVHADLVSFLDCHFERTSEDFTVRSSEASPDDELGHAILYEECKLESMGAHGFHGLNELIVETAIRLSRGTLEDARSTVENVFGTRALFRDRVAYEKEILSVLERLVPLSTPLMGVYLDYEPWIRYMVQIEDLLEAQGGGEQMGRRTRNSQKYVRLIELSEGQQRSMIRTKMKQLL